jgi:hypothetical protein
MYRQSYYASRTPAPMDRRQFVTNLRMTEAGQYGGDLTDIEVSLKPPVMSGGGTSRTFGVEVHIRSARLPFVEEAGRYRSELDIGVYCTDASRRLVCDTVQRMNLTFPRERYQRFPQEGLTHITRVPLSGRLVFVKVMVYNYAADIIGAASHRWN